MAPRGPENPKANRPKVLIYDVPTRVCDNELLRDILGRNLEESFTKSELDTAQVWFRQGPKGKESYCIVLEACEANTQVLMIQERFYLDMTPHRVKEYMDASRR